MAKELSAREQKIREARAAIYQGKMLPVLQKMDAGTRLTVEDRKTFDDAELELQDLDADLDIAMKARGREEGRDEAAESRGMSRDEHDNEDADYTRAFCNYFRQGKD